MRRAGCVGINFTSDSTHPQMLATYRQPHRREDLIQAVTTVPRARDGGHARSAAGRPRRNARNGRPRRSPASRACRPDCAGAALGIRIYPGTRMADAGGGGRAAGKQSRPAPALRGSDRPAAADVLHFSGAGRAAGTAGPRLDRRRPAVLSAGRGNGRRRRNPRPAITTTTPIER